jgi:hypothetical protein
MGPHDCKVEAVSVLHAFASTIEDRHSLRHRDGQFAVPAVLNLCMESL